MVVAIGGFFNSALSASDVEGGPSTTTVGLISRTGDRSVDAFVFMFELGRPPPIAGAVAAGDSAVADASAAAAIGLTLVLSSETTPLNDVLKLDRAAMICGRAS